MRGLFDAAAIEDDLRTQVHTFLASVSEFLDLLLGIRNLPEGEEFVDDRVVGTLKCVATLFQLSYADQLIPKYDRLMSFVRGVSASPIFVRYIERLRDYHIASGNFTEAGLTLKVRRFKS